MQIAHAYVCAGMKDSVAQVVDRLRTTYPDSEVVIRMYDSLGIDDARDIREKAALRGFTGRRIFILVATHMGTEAQNALLKTVEEPPAGAIFALVLPAPETLIPTLRSRMQVLAIPEGRDESPIDAAAFLAADGEQRIKMLSVLTAAEEKDTAGALVFLAALETILSKKPAARSGVEAVYRARKFLLDRGALRKPLLEHVALLVPRVV